MAIPLSPQEEALVVERARAANMDPSELLGEIVRATLGDADGQLAASEQDFAEGRVHTNADALRQLRETVERVAGPRPRQ